jgi:hypothetical protein
VRHIVHATPFPDPAELVQKPGRPRKGRSPRSRQGKREAVVLVEWLWMDQEEAATAPWGSGRDRFGPARQGSTGGTERRRSRYRARGTGSVPGDVGAEERDHVRHRGEYLELTIPNLPVEGEGDDRRFAGCIDGNLKSWVAAIDTEPGDAFYGYNSEPGRTEEFWILDVDGTRLVIEANWSPASPREDVAEMRAILDSIRIEP